MDRGVYKVVLEFDLMKELKTETLENFFRTLMDKSGSLTLLNMSEPVLLDSDQAAIEAILVEGIRRAALEEDLTRVIESVRSGL